MSYRDFIILKRRLDWCSRGLEVAARYGHSRSVELSETIGKEEALVAETDGRLTGYASGFGYLGHAVGESNLDLEALLCAVEGIEGPGISGAGGGVGAAPSTPTCVGCLYAQNIAPGGKASRPVG